jgi:inosine/xanthosine triphosphate pyrophosphatase family protein
MNKKHQLADIKVLTTNPKKSKDFKEMGFGVYGFEREIDEVLSDSVEEVALYKCKDADVPGGLVEDTSLAVEGLPWFGTQIKQIWSAIEKDESLNGRRVVWEVALAVYLEGTYYVAKGVTEGVLKYPLAENGYHFDRVFSIPKDGEWCQFENLTDEEKIKQSPRFKAMRTLKEAFESGNYDQLQQFKEKEVLTWSGSWQSEVKDIEGKKSVRFLK